MVLIQYLRDADFGLPDFDGDRAGYTVRNAGRVVMTNGRGEVALMKVTKSGVYKLPGGGIEEHEPVEIGIKREVVEETGFDCEVGEEIGLVVEFRDQWKMVQLSHCFRAITVGQQGETALTDEEKERGFTLVWVTPDEAIKLMEANTGKDYDSWFMPKRDLAILKKAFGK